MTWMQSLMGIENRLSKVKKAIDSVRENITDFDNFLLHRTSSVYCNCQKRE